MREKDRKLLELAAKAAGIHNLMWDDSAEEFMNIEIRPGAICCAWNPLRNDGDALRLAVKLRLCVSITLDGVSVSRSTNEPLAWERTGVGSEEIRATTATRRAIVRAAAAIATSHPPAYL